MWWGQLLRDLGRRARGGGARRRRGAVLAVGVIVAAGFTLAAGAPAAASTPMCALGDLYLAVGQVTGGAGSVFVPVDMTNTSTHPCYLRGYPGVSVLDVVHGQIGAPAERNGATVATVVLGPDQTASATIRTTNPALATCRPTAAYLRIYPPGSFTAALLPYPLRVCGAFEVNPVAPGAG